MNTGNVPASVGSAPLMLKVVLQVVAPLPCPRYVAVNVVVVSDAVVTPGSAGSVDGSSDVLFASVAQPVRTNAVVKRKDSVFFMAVLLSRSGFRLRRSEAKAKGCVGPTQTMRFLKQIRA